MDVVTDMILDDPIDDSRMFPVARAVRSKRSIL